MPGDVKRSISVYLNLNEANKAYQTLEKQVAQIKTSMQGLTKGSKEYAASEKELRRLEAALKEQKKIIDNTPGSILNVRRAYRETAAELNRMIVGSAEYNDKLKELKSLQSILDNHNQSLRGAGDGLSGLIGKLGGLGTIFGAVGIVSVGSAAADLVGQMKNLAIQGEQTKKAFETLLGSESDAALLMKQLAIFSKEAGIALPDDQINKTAKTLLGFGFSAGDVLKTMTHLNDVSAATGKDLNELAVVYGQVRLSGRLMSQDLLQFINAGVPLIPELAKNFGVAEGSIKKMVEQGKIGFKDVEHAFETMTSKGGIFADFSKTQLGTAAGQFAVLKKEILSNGKAMFEELLPAITEVTKGLIVLVKWIFGIPELIRENKNVIAALTVAMISFNAQSIIAAANSLRLAAAEKARTIATTAATVAQRLLNGAMKANPIGFIIGLVATLAAGFLALYNRSQTVRAGIAGLGAVANEVFNIVKESVGAFINGFKNLSKGNFKAAFKDFGDAFVKSNPLAIAFTQGGRLAKAYAKGYSSKIQEETNKPKKAEETVGAFSPSAPSAGGSGGDNKPGKPTKAQLEAERQLKAHIERVNKLLEDARTKQKKDDESDLVRKEIDIRNAYEKEIELAKKYAESKNAKVAAQARDRQIALETAMQEELLIVRGEYLEKNQKKIQQLTEEANRNAMSENEREIQAIKDKYNTLIEDSRQLEKDLADATQSEREKAAQQTQTFIDLMNKEIQTKTEQQNAKLVAEEAKKNEKLAEERKKAEKDYKKGLQDMKDITVSVGDEMFTSLDEHYTNLLNLARQYGLDTVKITEEYERKKQEIQRQSNIATLVAYGDAFGQLSDVIEKFTDEQGKQGRDWVILQRGLALVQIATDTAKAISSLVAASSANPTNAVTFGAAGAAQFVAGLAQILGNIAAARKLLTTPIPQAYTGGYRDVTGAQDGRRYRARYLGSRDTGMLPTTPSLVLASEKGPEYYVSNDSLRNPKVARLVRMIDNIEHGRGVTQRADGGVYPDNARIADPGGGDFDVNLLYTVLNLMLRRLNEPLYAILPDTTIIASNERLQSMNKSSGGRLLKEVV